MPVPLSDTVCEAIGAANATVNVPVARPGAIGLKVTLNEQVALGANFLLLQAVPAENGDGAVTLVTVIEVVPVFFTVTAVAGLVVPTNWLPKFMLDGETVVPCA